MKDPIRDFVAVSFPDDDHALFAFKLTSGKMIEVEMRLDELQKRGVPIKTEHAEVLEQMRLFSRSVLCRRDPEAMN